MSIARHTAYNLIGAVSPLAMSLVTVPIYLRTIGLDRYGMLTICWLLIGYLGLFDFGIGRATAQRLAKLGNGSREERSDAFWLGLSISGAFAVGAILIAIVIVPVLLDFIDVRSAVLRREVLSTVPMIVFAVPIAIIQSVLRGALEGRREFLIVNVAITVAAIGTAAMPLFAAMLWGPQLQHLVAASLAPRLCLLMALGAACWLKIPVGNYHRPPKKEIKSAVQFGAWLTVTNITGPLMVAIDRFFIGASLGPAAVAIYVIPLNVVSQLAVVPAALGNAMFPSLTVSSRSDELNRRALFGVSFLVSILSSLAIVLVGPFFELWIGGTTAKQSTNVALVLVAGAWANAMAQIPHVSLQAAGRTDVAAKVHLAEFAPYLLLLWFALAHFGIIGAAAAWSIRCVVDYVALTWFDRVRGEVLRRTLTQGALVLFLAVATLKAETESVLYWLMVTFAGGALAWYLYSVTPPRIVQYLRELYGPR